MTRTTFETPTKIELKDIILPPMPATLLRLDSERAKAEPNLHEIARIIERDMSVSAAVIKTINSPLFGLRRKLDSISQAVILLGLEHVSNLVTALSLRESMRGTKFPAMDQFFESTQDVALVMSAVADELYIMSPSQAYLLGLFHHCGIPLLFQQFPEYSDVLRMANTTQHRPMTAIEDEYLRTDHTQVGYVLSKGWKVPHATCLAILYHHCAYDLLAASQSKGQPDRYIVDLTNAVALLTMAEAISDRFRRREASHDWERAGAAILTHFDLTETTFEALMKDMGKKLAE